MSRRVADVQVEAMDRINDAAHETDRAEADLYAAVEEGRTEAGLSWAEIGRALGVTRSAAQQRFSKPPKGRLV